MEWQAPEQPGGVRRPERGRRRSIGRVVEFREQLAEIHAASQFGLDDEIGPVETVAVSHLEAMAVRAGDPNVLDAELQIIGDLFQHVGWLVVRG